MKTDVRRLACLALAAILTACSGKGGSAAAPGNSPDAGATRDEAGASRALPLGKQLEGIGSLTDQIVAKSNALPRAEFDPGALVATLGKDPQKLYEWVRDRTSWAPYRGLLRGSRGVLLDRVGSNMDRAVLLGELLSRSGQEVRLAHAQLSESRARELLAKIRTIPDRQPRSVAQGKAPAERQRIEDTARALVDAQTKEIDLIVKDAGTKASARDSAAALDAMRDHWWVERKEGSEWKALDVLLPDGQPGNALAAASSTSAWNAKESRPSVPDTEWHTVHLRLVVERYEGGVTTESTVLERLLRPAELLERPILLLQMPRPWPESFPDASADPNARGNAAVNVKEWIPILQIGDELVAQSGFSDDGSLVSAPFDAKRDIAALGGGAAATGFADALGGGGAPSSTLTAEWLDYEIHVPGAPAQRIRRPVFDLLGPQRRLAKAADFDATTNERLVKRYEALLGATQIFLQVSDITGGFLAHLETRGIVENQAAIRELSKERDPAKARKLAAAILERLDNWGPLPALALWRADLGGHPRTSFIDRPNVLNYRVGGPIVNADRVAFREQMDIASNSTGVTWGSAQNAFQVRVRQGVADTVAEVLALGGNFSTTQNTSVLFEKSGSDASRSILVAARDSSAVKGLTWPDEAAGFLGEDVAAGFIAVALRQPVMVDDRPVLGWWRIDPVSGETIGVTDTGFHNAMDERVETELEIAQLRNALRNWLRDNASRIRAARARANVPWDAAAPGDAELLQTTNRVMDVLRQAALAGF